MVLKCRNSQNAGPSTFAANGFKVSDKTLGRHAKISDAMNGRLPRCIAHKNFRGCSLFFAACARSEE